MSVSLGDERAADDDEARTTGISSQRVVYRGERRACLTDQLLVSDWPLATEWLATRPESRPKRRFHESIGRRLSSRSYGECLDGRIHVSPRHRVQPPSDIL